MQVKRFRASSMQEALDQVKKELGEEAVILKSEKVQNNGFFDIMKKDLVEVVAAIDVSSTPLKLSHSRAQSGGGNLPYFKNQQNMTSSSNMAVRKPNFSTVLKGASTSIEGRREPHKSQQRTQGRGMVSRKPVSKVHPAIQSGSKRNPSVQKNRQNRSRSIPQNDKMIQSLRLEVNDLKTMVKSLTGVLTAQNGLTIKEFADLPSPFAHEVMTLIQNGVDKEIAKHLVEKSAASIPIFQVHQMELLRKQIISEMSKMIQTSGPITCRKGKTKVIALVGPTGVGKTTTLAKLAANSKFVFDKRVSLISADTYRMSAIEHLNTFAGIAHLPLSAVYSPAELKASLSAQYNKDLIFIDTAGRSPNDKAHLKELKQFMETANPDEIHLVLPANIKHMDLLESLRKFDFLGINRIVISKIDETCTLGSILNITSESGKPLSYITNGQTIPDDIDLANSQTLANMIMRAA